MRDQNTEPAKETKLRESIDADDLWEIGDVSDTKGGWGPAPDGHGGQVFG